MSVVCKFIILWFSFFELIFYLFSFVFLLFFSLFFCCCRLKVEKVSVFSGIISASIYFMEKLKIISEGKRLDLIHAI